MIFQFFQMAIANREVNEFVGVSGRQLLVFNEIARSGEELWRLLTCQEELPSSHDPPI